MEIILSANRPKRIYLTEFIWKNNQKIPNVPFVREKSLKCDSFSVHFRRKRIMQASRGLGQFFFSYTLLRHTSFVIIRFLIIDVPEWPHNNISSVFHSREQLEKSIRIDISHTHAIRQKAPTFFSKRIRYDDLVKNTKMLIV